MNNVYGNTAYPQIDLGDDGMDTNDLLDADSGPNERQNYPDITLGIESGSGLRIGGRMMGAPNQTYQVDLYRVVVGSVEKSEWFASISVTTDSTGNAVFDPLFPQTVNVGDGFEATATDAAGNTSEFGYIGAVSGPSPLEPNDTIATAGATNLSHTTPGEFSSFGTIGNGDPLIPFGLDVDMLRVQLNAGDRLTMKVIGYGNDADADTVLRLFDASGNQLAISDDTAAPGGSAGVGPYIDFTALTTGTYYLGISGTGNMSYKPSIADSGTPGDFGAYSFTMTVFTPSKSEPNDTIGQATDTGLSFLQGRMTYSINAAIGDVPTGDPFQDVDMYKVHLNTGDQIVINVATATLNPASSLDSSILVFDASGHRLASNSALPPMTSDAYLVFTAPAVGDYYVGISSNFNTGYDPNTGSGGVDGTAGPYHLSIQLLPFMYDPNEPNNSPFDATNTGLQGSPGSYTTPGYIAVSDIDLFRLSVAPGQQVTIKVQPTDPNSGLHPHIALLNASGTVLADSLSGSLEYNTSANAALYVKIYSDDPSDTGPYILYIGLTTSVA
jgi:hypothetical protein